MKSIFSRNVPGMTKVLRTKCAAIAGCGGLGSNVATLLVRAGIGSLILVDPDKVEYSNLNRQQYFIEDVGKKKVDCLSHHLKRINPGINVVKFCERLSPENAEEILGNADLIVEAFDRAEDKCWLIDTCCKLFPQKPLICGNGLAGYGKTDEIKVTKVGNIWFCGDGKSDLSEGLCSARVTIVAAMQANVAIEVLMSKR